MIRRTSTDTNAGSMADIAFLLLVFFLVVTTMNTDKGLKRLLPKVITEPYERAIVIDRNVYEVMVNLNNDLLVENELMSISDLRQGAKGFLTANGDNILYPLIEPLEHIPIRVILNEDSVKQRAVALEQELEMLQILEKQSLLVDSLDKVKALIKTTESELSLTYGKQYAFEFFGKYASLPTSALISVQNDNATAYETYLAVNNELEAAIRELRDELSLAKFGVIYDSLNDEDDEDKMKILAIRAVYPQRISEAEPIGEN